MNDAEPAAQPRARVSRPVWPGLVWAIPLSALIIVLFLGVRAFVNRGIDAVVSFDSATGVKIGDTKVVYQGYEVGRVVKIDVAHDIHRIDLTVRLDHRAKSVLRDRTVFWMVGAKASLSDINSVKAAFSGPTIGISPSTEGKPTRHFQGLSEEPAVPPGAEGSPFVLSAERLGSVKRRSSIVYRGQEVGKVTATAMQGPGRFRVDVFIFKPFDRLVRPGTVFWPSSAVQLSLGAGGVSARLDDPSALLSGGLQLDVPEDAPAGPSPPGSQFLIYPSREAAEAGPPGPRVAYAMAFPGAGGDLDEGAPVTLLGFHVGEVTSRTLDFDPTTGEPLTRVVVGIEPARLKAGGDPSDPTALRASSDAAVRRLLARGYRAELTQTPPLIGARGVALVRLKTVPPAALQPGRPPQIPAAPGAGDLGEQASSILGKIDRVPIERIGQDVGGITRRVRALVSSPKVDDSLDHLHSTLTQVDRITAEAEPQVGPLIAKLRKAADEAAGAAGAARGLLTGEGADPDASLPHAVQELSDAAVSMRALADGLARHPEALVKGKGKP